MKVPQFLKKGDKIGIVATASSVPNGLKDAIDLLESWGLEVILGGSTNSVFHQFSGDDRFRANDLQKMLDDASIKAIIAARGGYGTVRIIDQLDFTQFEKNPKWVVGFSDLTVLHCHVHRLLGIPTIHGQMPLTIPDATKASLDTLRKALFGDALSYTYESTGENIEGEGAGILVGGNLAVLSSISGSDSEIEYKDKILFIEDVGEYYYAIDRMMWMLKRAKKLKDLRGLVIGGFTAMKDKKPGFGFSVEEIVFDLVREYGYPVATDFPAGHIDNNMALIFGREVSLQVKRKSVRLDYI